MNENSRVAALTKIAFLNAIVLAFLATQVVVPILFFVYLGILPSIVALVFFHAPLRTTALAWLVLVIVALILFGPSTGLWALVYSLVGAVLGIAWRLGLPWPARLVGVVTAYILALAGVTAAFAWISQVSWQDIVGLGKYLEVYGLSSMPSVLAVGLSAWAIILGFQTHWVLGRVLCQLDREVVR